MKLTVVNEVPEARHGKKNLQEIIDGFNDSDAKCVKIEFDDHDYSSFKVGTACMRTAVKRSRYPIQVCQRDNNLYLRKL